MIRTRVLVIMLSESCRRDVEITCRGQHIFYCFWSGSRGNHIEVKTNEENELVVTTVTKTWQEFLRTLVRDVIETNLNRFIFWIYLTLGVIN